MPMLAVKNGTSYAQKKTFQVHRLFLINDKCQEYSKVIRLYKICCMENLLSTDAVHLVGSSVGKNSGLW